MFGMSSICDLLRFSNFICVHDAEGKDFLDILILGTRGAYYSYYFFKKVRSKVITKLEFNIHINISEPEQISYTCIRI